MKPSPFFCRAMLFVFLLSCIDVSATHKAIQPPDTVPHYVVIGAFSFQKNAIKFVSHVNKDLKLNASFDINPNRKLYYVYCLSTLQSKEAMNEALRLRGETELQDAWVYHGVLGNNFMSSSGKDTNPVDQQPMNVVAVEETYKVSEPVIESVAESDVSRQPITTKNEITPIAIVETSNATGKAFVFEMTRFVDSVPVEGEVAMIDPDKVKKLGSYPANKAIRVVELKNNTGMVTFTAEVFGYRKAQKDFSYVNPESDTTGVKVDENGIIHVPFELIRLKQGDFAILYNVYFFRDAAVMRPESRFEINSLLEMLRENPKYIVRIHGHTNGNHAGKIIYKDKSSEDFFSLNGTKDGYGSAKELSKSRAEVIRDYLVAQGISPERALVKAWGGKKSIHDKHSAKAQENVRVEIEIVKD
ncbi:OmpA family protein [Chryseotalea sanaruensis]|nr:OmpA family protein [Chryseotalea sanaruensis]